MINKQASGHFVLRLPTQTHTALREKAFQMGISLNALCTEILEDFLKRNQQTIYKKDEREPSWLEAIHDLLGESLLGIILFGSAARGELRDSSDIDLLIIINKSLPLNRQLYLQWDERFSEDRHSPHFVHLPADVKAASAIWLEAALDGVLFYDRDGVISRFLGQVRHAIASGELRRLSAYGIPYWVKNEKENSSVQ